MNRLLATLAFATALTPSATFAQEPPAFTGPYIQGEVGYDKSRSGSDVDIDDLRDSRQSIDGVVYGAGVGFDFAVGDALRIGAEGSVSDSTAKWKRNSSTTSFNLGRVSAGRDLYAGARVGFVTSPNLMVYAKGGYSNARYSSLGSDGTTELRDSIDADGYRLGAGVEYQTDGSAFARLEYRYSNYSRGELDFGGQTPDSSRFDLDTDRHQVVASVGLRF